MAVNMVTLPEPESGTKRMDIFVWISSIFMKCTLLLGTFLYLVSEDFKFIRLSVERNTIGSSDSPEIRKM